MTIDLMDRCIPSYIEVSLLRDVIIRARKQKSADLHVNATPAMLHGLSYSYFSVMVDETVSIFGESKEQ